MTTILSVALENHPGALADVLEVVGQAGINIHAIEAQAMGDFGGVRLQVADPAKAAEALRKKKFDVVEADALEIELPNKPGVLAKVARQLAEHKINIVALFGTTPVGGAAGRLLLRCTHPEEARKVLSTREGGPRQAKRA